MLAKLIIHHSLQSRKKHIDLLLTQFGFSANHPDLLYLGEIEGKIGIDQTKAIKKYLSIKPLQATFKTVVILEAGNLTLESQNSLLKTIEEPAGENLIILGAASEDLLIPTILSRCELVYLPENDKNVLDPKIISEIEKLISLNYEQRFKYIEKLDTREQFLDHFTLYLQDYLKNLARENALTSNHIVLFKELVESYGWRKSNVNIRAILEYLVLIIPLKSPLAKISH